MENQEKPHKRRVRYSGTHPKRFSEKYKEHQPEKYADVVEKVIRKGSTPAGMHISICVKEILDFLQIQPGQRGLDVSPIFFFTRYISESFKDRAAVLCCPCDPYFLISIPFTRKQRSSL